MSDPLKRTKLYRYLKRLDERLAARADHVREEMSRWLPGVVQLFPHYPSHGLDHSDRIVEQLSLLLFNGNKPVVNFSSAEIYCLICAAYLHDMGMVVSPGDSAQILASDAWAAFVSLDGKGYVEFKKYEEQRAEPSNVNLEAQAFLSSHSLRLLIAEFVRRDHHHRGKTTLELHPFLRQLVDQGDSVAFDTIADLGVGHGLDERELEDKYRFPEERDVLGGKVNVKFLARLLRIGDLLDMDSRRSDPMAMRVAMPLPPSARPHWAQYSDKKHGNVTSEEIEFRFECRDQDTHRVLLDWLTWLEQEVRSTGLSQAHAVRHGNWKPPRCKVRSQATAYASEPNDDATIIVVPARTAGYEFHDWKLELDPELVLERLIRDVYDDTTVFVRELIQNGLDATRCQMYGDFNVQRPLDVPPVRPTGFDPSFRKRYGLRLTLNYEEIEQTNEPEAERQLVFTIEDKGTGMGIDIIRRYFLQVGRSYYRSADFRQNYKFAPTSRFGIGFLSVFAVSRNIVVETAHREAQGVVPKGIRLRLRGPTGYLLTEPWYPFQERRETERTGTRIRVVLDEWPKDLCLLDLVKKWCVAAEVPIEVDEHGKKSIVETKKLADGMVLGSSRVEPNAQFILRVFELNEGDVEGQLAVVAYVDGEGEAWCDRWSSTTDLSGSRVDNIPRIERNFIALHGIDVDVDDRWIGGYYRFGTRNQWIRRLDIRGSDAAIPLSRTIASRSFGSRRGRVDSSSSQLTRLSDRAAQKLLQEVLTHHLQGSSRTEGMLGGYYVADVLSGANVNWNWASAWPSTVVAWKAGLGITLSVDELLSLESVSFLACSETEIALIEWKQRVQQLSADSPDDILVGLVDVPSFAQDEFLEKIIEMKLVDVACRDFAWALRFEPYTDDFASTRLTEKKNLLAVPMSNAELPAISFGNLDSEQNFTVFNTNNPYGIWISFLSRAIKYHVGEVPSEHIEALFSVATDYVTELDGTLEDWAISNQVPEDYRPPKGRSGDLLPFAPILLWSRKSLQ